MSVTASSLSKAAAGAQAAALASRQTRGWRLLALGGLCVGAALMPAIAATGAEAVGHVSLLIGQAHLVHADGSRSALQRGSPVAVGDRIETGANGQVHLHFVDNAAVAVRPDSVMQVQAYQYDPRRPEASEVRLKLERGTGRSLSGGATQVDKTRFRLNTPIAAIGVRGTDFVVHAQADAVRATVADGAIVVSPYGVACQASGLGPCAGLDSRELSAAMGRLMAEVRPGERSTNLVPATDLAAVSTALAQDRQERNANRQQQALELARNAGLTAAEPTPGQQQRGNDQAAAEVLTLAAVRMPNLNRPPELGAQLVWGRWAVTSSENDKLTLPFALARVNRQVTVADQEMGLFRREGAGSGGQLLPEATGVAQFRLTRASASFEGAQGLEVAAILASNLTVDFNRRTFATALNLSTPSGATGGLRLAGDVRADGIFALASGDQRVAGAVALNGKEAGYLFETGTAGQLFRGRTLWSAGP